MSAGTFRVKIPRAPPSGAETTLPAGSPAPPPEALTTELPGTFITAMPPLLEPTMKELEVTVVLPASRVRLSGGAYAMIW